MSELAAADPVVTVRYWAAAKSATGTAQETHRAGTLADLLTRITSGRDAEVRRVLERCSFLVDSQAVGTHQAVELSDGVVVDVLPPFAGG